MKVFLIISFFILSFGLFGEQPAKIMIFYTEAGGGHKTTAKALQSALEEKFEGSEIILLNTGDNLGNLIENLRFKSLETIYTQNLGSPFGRCLNRLVGDWIIGPITKTLEFLGERQISLHKDDHPLIRFFKKEKPDLVISTSSFTNKFIKTALEYADISAPFIVVMSDFDEVQEVMWTSPGNGTNYIIRTHAKLKNNIDPKYLFPISGMCIRSDFTPKKSKSYEIFQELKLSIIKPTALVSFGGHGSEEMHDLLSYFNLNQDLQAIFVCGSNSKLYKSLSENVGPNCRILGFVENMHTYMQACHVLIGKPGPGTVTEAAHTHLPLFLKSGLDLMKQEISVLDWVLEERFGQSWDSFEEFQNKFPYILSNLHLYKKNLEAKALKNPTAEAVEHIYKIFNDSLPEIPQAKMANYTFY